MSDELPTILAATSGHYPLHLLGWKGFQDLAVSVAEECLHRPVQTFLPTNDAGRDGAFVGTWSGSDPAGGQSTIQSKFTSKPGNGLTLSLLKDELAKARRLASKGLAKDYIILTNHAISGQSDLAIREAFQDAGVDTCRVFGENWICDQIKKSARLRMMVPRLYGLGDLTDLLDTRAYAQAQLILSSMGSDIQRLVVTDAHRDSVRAISKHNMVLLLGAPAAGKSTIGASIAVGAADLWGCSTIRATSPEEVREHLDPFASQFFWIDDAWGSTQYQAQTAEAWNKTFPLMQGAIKNGTRFLITSRDYIWNSARSDLKLQAIPPLRNSQVIINVENLSIQEKAQILYNHIKLGDHQPRMKKTLKDFLPALAERKDFLPETARRVGTQFFSESIKFTRDGLDLFFSQPQDFLYETISNLAEETQAAIASIFANGGKLRSPIRKEAIDSIAEMFGPGIPVIKKELESLNGSLLILAQDEHGSFWTYKHPTVSDAFSKFISSSPEKIGIFLRGAKARSLVAEVICPGVEIWGATVIVPTDLFDLLIERIGNEPSHVLRSFITHRSNAAFSRMLLAHRPDLLDIFGYYSPISEDGDASFVAKLHSFAQLPEDTRLLFVQHARNAAVERGDSSMFDDGPLQSLFKPRELAALKGEIRTSLVANISNLVEEQKSSWDSDYDPEDHFDELTNSVKVLISILPIGARAAAETKLKTEIRSAINEMERDYEPSASSTTAISQSVSADASLVHLFRDVDE